MNIKRLVTILFLLLIFPMISRAGDYVIGEGDGLEIAVWGVKELTFSVKVRPDGKITVPGLGDIVASGFTPKNLQSSLAEKLKELVKNPIVTVTVKEITNSKVYVFGGGVNSGVFDLNRRMTLLQLLCVIGGSSAGGIPTNGTAAIGGSAKVADYKKAYILRNGKKIKEGFFKLFVNGDTGDDIALESNDSIFIPLLMDNNIYVLGAVNVPKAIEYREGMTVIEAILEAGNFNKFAAQNDVVIKRKNGHDDISITVKAKKLINDGDLTQNVALKPGDYVVVKESFF